MMLRKLFVIVDYNLSRLRDVKLMTTRAKEKHALLTVLIRNNPETQDRELADYVIDLDPLAPDFADQAADLLKELGEPVAIVPFSDNSVVSGSALAEKLGLPGDSSRLGMAAFSKIAYRRAEEELVSLFPQSNFFTPQWCEVSSLDEVYSFSSKVENGFIVKPSCEGNNRGVIKVESGEDPHAAFLEVSPYLGHGALCEELINLPEEYSFDGIGELSFVTKKSTAHGRYPVEFGQTVPCRLPTHLEESVKNAGKIANVIVGQKIGPFHNEIRLDPKTALAAVIEPNRRPAGMHIWHLAKKVYGVDFFELWVDTLLGQKTQHKTLTASGVASIRMLAAPRGGQLDCQLDSDKILKTILAKPTVANDTAKYDIKWSDFSILVQPGMPVTNLVDNNSKFIAQIVAYSPFDHAPLETALDSFQHEWAQLACNIILPKDLSKKETK